MFYKIAKILSKTAIVFGFMCMVGGCSEKSQELFYLYAFALNVVSTINGEQYSQEVSCKLNEVDMGRNGNYYKLSSTFFGKCQNSDKLYVSAFKNGGSWTGVTIRGIFIPVD